MRLWYLALLGLLCGISIANAQESDHSPSESPENLSPSIEKTPTTDSVQSEDISHKESSGHEGLSSEEVHREFEEYPQHSGEDAVQNVEKPSDEPENTIENAEPVKETEEEPKKKESSHEVEDQPEMEDHDDEEKKEEGEAEQENEGSISEVAPEPENNTEESPEEKEELVEEPELEDENDLEVPPEWENEEEMEDVEELDDTSSEGEEAEMKNEESIQSGGENVVANVEEESASSTEPEVGNEVDESINSNNTEEILPENSEVLEESPSDDVAKPEENAPEQAINSPEQKDEVSASETETPKEEVKESSIEAQQEKLHTTAEIRAALIALAQKAYRKVIEKEDKKDEAEELRAEPKLDTSEEKQINQLLTKDVDEKEEAVIENAEKVEEESIINDIKEHEKLVRLRRQAKEHEVDPTEQPAGASPVELPMETKDITGKNETLPAEINNDVPKNETAKQDQKKVKFTDAFGWIHYPWKKIPISKRRFHYSKQCGCQVMWIKKVYTRPRPKSKLLLVQSSYIDLKKPCRRIGHKHHNKDPRMRVLAKNARRRHTPCLRGKKSPLHKFHRSSSMKFLAEKSWHSHVHKKKRAVREGKKAFAKRFRVKGKKHFKPLH